MKYPALITLTLILSSCAAVHKSGTLADIDISGGIHQADKSHLTRKNEQQIRAAYAEYLKHAGKNDLSRRDALQRLAQLEFKLTEQLEQNNGVQNSKTQSMEDKLYYATLDRSITLLKTSLHDYPKAKNNDRTLYQLAKAYDQRGYYDKSISTLKTLVSRYPNSRYYVESEFRLGEAAFSLRKYSKAEDLYTNVIVSPKNSEYLENALYKRGWARYKQGYYQDAIADFLHVINIHEFKQYADLNKSEQSQFNEYFRAVALSFSYLGGAQSLDTYFEKHPDFKYIYHTYERVSEIYLKQQRYSDAAATLTSFIKFHPKSPKVPLASIKILDIWHDGGFDNKLIPALGNFYALYHPQSSYWSSHNETRKAYDKVTNSIRHYTVYAAAYYHKRYMALHGEDNFEQARQWYRRYLKYYSDYSGKDNINLLYAELLSAHHNPVAALANYEKAAYDSGIILNKNAAYETILLANQLYEKSTDSTSKNNYLGKVTTYSLRFCKLYTNDKRTLGILTHAAQIAYKAGQYSIVVKLAEIYHENTYTKANYNLGLIKANAYFKLQHFQDAEAAYLTILNHYQLKPETRQALADNLGISVYNQGKQAQSDGDIDVALSNYSRIYKIAPQSQSAPAGLYDAIVLSMDKKRWEQAINYIKQFQQAYPRNKLSQDVSKKLSIAYLNSHQDLAAANELVKIAHNESDSDYKRAALWKAGQLYEAKNDTASAIKSYREYAHQYRKPFPQYMEAMNKLTTLYAQSGSQRLANKWRNAIIRADKRTPSDKKTDRTRYISSIAALSLAIAMQGKFNVIKLTVPLKRSLALKKTYMQKATDLYGLASSYGIAHVATQATFAIGQIYQSFSKALLTSERPKGLSKEELDQYNILLEDKSYPFEDKAIEFYATNLAHVRDGIYDKWMKQSYARLQKLYPERYSREVKLEPYINVIQ